MVSAFADRPLKKLVLFDVDGTLSLARQHASKEMIEILRDLRKKMVIGFVGGSDLVKISEQIVVEDFDYGFAENGLIAYKLGKQLESQSFIKFLGEEKYKKLANFILHYIADMDIPIKRGTFIEFRNGMVNVSPIGRNATIEERLAFEAYDKEHGLRAAFVKVLQEKFADYGLTYSIGGQISFDVFPHGWDKTYALKHVEDEGFEEIHFFGDKTYKARTLDHSFTTTLVTTAVFFSATLENMSSAPYPAKESKPLSRARTKPDPASDPAIKRRKLGPSQGSQPVESSFADVLQRIKEEGGEGNGAQHLILKIHVLIIRVVHTPLNEKRDKIVFQQIDVEESQEGNGQVTLRMFGVTEAGHSVLAHITDFLPYFYIAVPRGFSRDDIDSFQRYLNNIAANEPVRSIEWVEKRSLWGYRGDDWVSFLKLTISDPRSLPKVRDESFAHVMRGECRFNDLFPADAVATFESNIAYTLRFMIDTKVVGMNWIEVPPGKYQLVPEPKKKSHCQIEINVRWDAFVSHAPEGSWSKIAPLRILSFDIECAGRKGIFPEAQMDPVIQIANMVTRQGEQTPFIRNIFTLNTCSHIVGSQVLSFKDEDKMLQAWRDFVEEVDPDVVIGYNIAGFDFPYLMDRAKALKANKFPYLGRLKNLKTEVKNTHFSSKAYGQRDSKETTLDGRLQLDVLQFMQREHKLRSYTLNSVCAQFLGEQKEDVHHSVITELQNGTPESRRRLAVYCLKDAYLPQRLLDKLMCFVNYIEMARVTGVPFNYLLSRGQSIKVLSQLFRKANADGYVIPALKGEGSDEQYEGATVIEPKKGYYDVPIATLDFSSLYPSIMMAHNLCYTTLLDKSTIDRLHLVKDVDYIQTPNNDLFATASRRKGLLPTVLEDLISARKRAKADLKNEKDPFKRAVLDGRQLALKISANSVYGFTGATIGKLPCLAISSSVTSYGRQMIEKTKQEVEAEYCIANGRSHNAEIVYGDTDSVMVRFGPTDLATVMALGQEAADFVTTKFVKPIKLEFEKVYFPYLLISKKRYAGLYWTRPDKYDKMDSKGIETVRRDNCRLVSTVIETCLHKMLIDRDVRGAEDYTKQTISDLLQNKVDMSQLVITKALAKSDYAGKQAHVELAERMKQRDAGSAPALGDRVAYVIIKGIKGAAAYEKSEDPLYVLENNLPIDTKYYLENQLSKPLMRIFEPILGEKASSLLSGDHTRTIQIATPTVGGLMKFAVKTVTCLGCKTPLRANNSMKNCPIFYMRKKAQKDVEDASSVLERFDGETW
ncbi:DNA-directed DNA polymerase delta [Blastosporella zonata]|nr:DNA-directed DNA polymerase delta [Blastosporella zonata]